MRLIRKILKSWGDAPISGTVIVLVTMLAFRSAIAGDHTMLMLYSIYLNQVVESRERFLKDVAS